MNKCAKSPEVAELVEKFDLQLFAEDENVEDSSSVDVNYTDAEDNVEDVDVEDEGVKISIGEKQALFDGGIGVEVEKEPAETDEVPEEVKREQSPEANAAFAEMRRKAEQVERELQARDEWVKENFGHQGLSSWEQYQAAIEEGKRREAEARRQQIQHQPQAVFQQTYRELVEQGYDMQVAHRLAKNEADNLAYALKVQALEEKINASEMAAKEQARQKAEQERQEKLVNQVLTDHEDLRNKYGDLVPDIESLDEKTVSLMAQGVPLRAAWLASNDDLVVEFARGKGAQKAVREINSKSHLETERGGGSGVGKQVHVSEEKLQVWRALGYSDKEARKKEAKYQRVRRE